MQGFVDDDHEFTEEWPRHRSAEQRSGFFSRLFFFFLHPLFDAISTKGDNFALTDLERVSATNEAKAVHKRFLRYWEPEMQRAIAHEEHLEALHADGKLTKEELEKRKKNEGRPAISMNWVMLRFFGSWLIIPAVISLITAATPFATPILMERIVKLVTDPNSDYSDGAIYAAIIASCQFVFSLGMSHLMRFGLHIGMDMRSALVMATFQKAMTISATRDVGLIMNLVGQDGRKVIERVPFTVFGTYLVPQVTGAFIYLFVLIGWPAIGGLVVFCIAVPLNYQLSERFIIYFIRKLMNSDQRVQLMKEVVNAIKIVKMYAWELVFYNQLTESRESEIAEIAKLLRLISYIMVSGTVAPSLLVFSIIALIVAEDPNGLTVPVFFQVLTIGGLVAMAMMILPWIYTNLVSMHATLLRFQMFLVEDEITLLKLDPTVPPGQVIVEGATFEWKRGEPVLSGVDFAVKPKELIQVVGSVGAGKTSLLAGILGEMTMPKGTVRRNGTLAYVAQVPWIIAGSVRTNIVMERPFDEAWYKKVVRACALQADLEMLPNGDRTEIGEKGINISGGQKQRIALARAVYCDSETYFLDDTLSAVDAHVGAHIFKHVIVGLLKEKTVVFVTNQLSFLDKATRLYVVDNGTLQERKLRDVTAANADPQDAFVKMYNAWKNKDKGDEKKEDSGDLDEGGDMGSRIVSNMSNLTNDSMASNPSIAEKDLTDAEKGQREAQGKLSEQEEMEKGAVSMSTYLVYLKSFGGWLYWMPMLLLMLAANAFVVIGQAWMAGLLDDVKKMTSTEDLLGGYGLLNVVVIVVVWLREWLWRTGVVRPSRVIHATAVRATLHRTMAFFDTTPTGRIMNRFTNDVDLLDFMLPLSYSLLFVQGTQVIVFQVTVSVLVYPFAPVAFVALLLVFYLAFKATASLTLRRLANTSQSPVIGIVSESLHGITSLRAYGKSEIYFRRFACALNIDFVAQYSERVSFEHLKLWVNIVGSVMAGVVLLLIAAVRAEISPAAAGMAVSISLSFTLVMPSLVQQKQMNSLAMNSVERLIEYTNPVSEVEAEGVGGEPDPDWPATGKIEMVNLSCRYRAHLPLVLKNVNLVIRGGEKIGIAGRTGSGKSTFLLSLFRMVPVDPESEVYIDGVRTTDVKLSVLRHRVAAIPQDPVLFNGTIRNNVDPSGSKTEDEIFDSLAKCGLKGFIEALPWSASREQETEPVCKLDYHVRENDFSVGQKQLLCMARAILKKMRILVLDEATSSIDVHTDNLIQKTIRETFRECTVITVAHRLNTILDADRILVFDKGEVAEFDTPKNLLADKSSILASMVSKTKMSTSKGSRS